MRNTGLSILWFLCGNQNTASSRLQGYLIHEELLKLGIDSHIVYSPNIQYKPDFQYFVKLPMYLNLKNTISIIQKLRGTNTDKLISWLKDCGSKIVYVNCDLETENHSWINADLILVTSNILLNYHQSYTLSPIQLISEPYEYSCNPFKRKKNRVGNSLISIAWFGNKENWGALDPWKRIIESEFFGLVELVTCSNHPDSTLPWSIAAQRNMLLKADIGILPTKNTLAFSAKSPNRLIQCMAMGIPCIAGPLPSYLEMQAGGAPVFIARSDNDFCFFLRELLNKNKRIKIGLKSYQTVFERFSSEAVAKQWINILELNRNICCRDNFSKFDARKLNIFLSTSKFAYLYSKYLNKMVYKACSK